MNQDGFLRGLLLVAVALCGGCMAVPKPSAEELQALDAPPAQMAQKVDHLLPRALAWYTAVEAELLRVGRPLTVTEAELAGRLGVRQPDKVRVVVLDRFPMPADPEVLAEARRHGLGSRAEGGRTQGYAIMLKPGLAEDPQVIAHELVHVAQHDRLGRAAFLRRYLLEMEMMGYARSPLELEAYARQGTALQSPGSR